MWKCSVHKVKLRNKKWLPFDANHNHEYFTIYMHNSNFYWLINSTVVLRVLFDLGIEKNYSAKLALWRDFYRLFIATSLDHWEQRMLFAYLIN